MPIEILGSDERSKERDAAESLSRILDPIIDPSHHLYIFVGGKCWGEETSDIDLLVLGTFGSGISFNGSIGESIDLNIRLINLCLIIEVKDLRPEDIRFQSNHVLVRYNNRWKSATDQVDKQKYSLINYLKRNIQKANWRAPWIKELIWLRNYNGNIPNVAGNVIGANLTIENFLKSIESINKPKRDNRNPGNYYIAFENNENINAIKDVTEFLDTKIEDTPYDRQRVERICNRLISNQKYVSKLGKQLLIFRGRGGSGKTVHLLRLANDLYGENKRLLFLTYNKALVADLRRLISIIGIDHDGFDQCIKVETVHKFFTDLLREWELWNRSQYQDHFPQKEYEKNLTQLLKLIEGKNQDELSGETAGYVKDIYDWDYILIDEAQDWLDDERDLLYKFFGAYRCIIADGIDQLIRRDSHCNWVGVYPLSKVHQHVHLKKALRMKSNLSRFINAFAEEAGYSWDQDINDDILGGSITIIRRPYDKAIHEEIFNRHLADGNEPIDSLFCVPPTNQYEIPEIVTSLQHWGYSIWDGTSSVVRETFPTKTSQHRIVKYDSCRGLEGWTVVLLGLDKFYKNKATYKSNENYGYSTPEMFAHRRAIAWTLIPLTRAIDHLVIQLEDKGPIYDICKKLARQYSDFITWKE